MELYQYHRQIIQHKILFQLEGGSNNFCANGDVKLEDDGTPLVFWNNVWSPICGHYFWDNQHGATKFCQRMGYDAGQLSWRDPIHRYMEDAFRIGRCNSYDDWTSCSDGCNDYRADGYGCSNNYNAYCRAGERVGITISCSGDSTKTSSCPGNE